MNPPPTTDAVLKAELDALRAGQKAAEDALKAKELELVQAQQKAAQADTLAGQVSQMQEESYVNKITTEVEAAVADGRVAPAQRDSTIRSLRLARSNPELVEALRADLKARPRTGPALGEVAHEPPSAPGSRALRPITLPKGLDEARLGRMADLTAQAHESEGEAMDYVRVAAHYLPDSAAARYLAETEAKQA